MKKILCFLTVIVSYLAHMTLSNPPPRSSKFSQYYRRIGKIDYNLNSPINLYNNKLCKGYERGPPTLVITNNTIHASIYGSAKHQGGHCQFGLTWNGVDMVVLKIVYYYCLVDSVTYQIPLPDNIPSGQVTFFWAWNNKIGNRELYMDCADVTIYNQNPNTGNVTGKEFLIFNIPGFQILQEGIVGLKFGQKLLNSTGQSTIIKPQDYDNKFIFQNQKLLKNTQIQVNNKINQSNSNDSHKSDQIDSNKQQGSQQFKNCTSNEVKADWWNSCEQQMRIYVQSPNGLIYRSVCQLCYYNNDGKWKPFL